MQQEKTITIEINSILRLKLNIVEFPDLTSQKKWIQKGINLMKKSMPKVLDYLSRQRILSQLSAYEITLRKIDASDVPPSSDERIKNTFKFWLKKEKLKRLVFVVIEALILPLTPILALLPGPNIFFYVPALLFYYHLTSYLGLKKIDINNLNLKILHVTA